MNFRKHLRLSPEIYRQNRFFFVTSVSRMRQPLFVGENRMIARRTLNALPDRFPGWSVDTSEIMPNHIHLILECAEERSRFGLGDVIGTLKSLIYRELRHRSGIKETIWQRNYYERVIRDEFELYAVREYIRRNPDKERFDWNDVVRSYSESEAGTSPAATIDAP